MSVQPLLLVAGILLILIALLDLSVRVRRIEKMLCRETELLRRALRPYNHCSSYSAMTAYSIWAYQGNKWVLKEKCGQADCDCGPPPSRPGQYQGEVVKKECPGGSES